MINRLKKILIIILLLLLGIDFILLIIGGGLGSKEPLPATFDNLPSPLLIAHRGAVGQFPENSLGAIQYAHERGYQAIEIDIQFSADSQFFVCHEFNADTVLGIPEITSKLTIAKLKQNPIIFNNNTTDQFIPTLAEVFKLYDDSAIFYLDMKRFGHDDIFDLTIDITALIKKHNMTDRVMIASAHVWFISWLEYNHPEFVTVLEGFPTDNPWVWSIVPVNFKADMIASREVLITKDFADWLSENKMTNRYITYHVAEKRVPELFDWGIENLMVDDSQFYDSLLQLNQ